MLKQIAWNTFKNTGDINTFMELMEVDKAMQNAKFNDQIKNNEIKNNEIKSNEYLEKDNNFNK